MRASWIALAVALASCSGGLRVKTGDGGGGGGGGEGPPPGGSGGGSWSESDCGSPSGPFESCDLDGDGCFSPSCGGTDCNDRDPTVHPGAREDCFNGLDDDCDGLVDEDVSSACGTCPDEPCYREELLGPGACRLGICEGVAVDAAGVLRPVGTGVHRFTRVFRASHATAQWSQLDVPITARLEARVATTRDALAASEPCATSSRPPLDLQTCNRALPARYLQARVTFSGEGWRVASLRLEWTRP